VAFYCGRCGWLPQARAAGPEPMPVPEAAAPRVPVPPPPAAGASDYASQPVAYLWGTVPITRADLGEYLIARFGADRLDLLMNHRIIDHACQEKGIEITAADVDAALNEDLKGLNVNKLDFVKQVLKRYNKTLFEWREDVIRPRLQLNRLCRGQIVVTDEELRQAFEAYYGERIKCRIIMWPKDERQFAMMQYGTIRDKPADFDRLAHQQASQNLSAVDGNIPPIGRHTLGDEETERAVFALQPGELSALRETPQGIIVFKCVQRIPPDKTKNLKAEQPRLEAEILEKKTQLALKGFFDGLRAEAKPQRLLAGYKTSDQVEKEVEEELRRSEAKHNARPTPPQGN
jgi:parvulin-like peptidyl-prolyl isomerase